MNGLSLVMMVLLTFQISKAITTSQYNTALAQKISTSNKELIHKNNELAQANLKRIEDVARAIEQYKKDHDQLLDLAKKAVAKP